MLLLLRATLGRVLRRAAGAVEFAGVGVAGGVDAGSVAVLLMMAVALVLVLLLGVVKVVGPGEARGGLFAFCSTCFLDEVVFELVDAAGDHVELALVEVEGEVFGGVVVVGAGVCEG